MVLTTSDISAAMPPHEAAAVTAWLTTFYPFQREWLLDWRRLGAVVKCRQIGGSHTFAGWCALRAMLGESSVMVSIRDTEARDLLGIAAKHLDVLHTLGSKWARIVRATSTELELASGARIRSTTSTAAGRGFSGNVLIDEFAYAENQQATWDAAVAATTHGFSCRIVSTPNGAGDIWCQLCTDIGHTRADDPTGWRIYRTTIDEAIAAGMKIDMRGAWDMARNDPRVFDQLFRGVFLDGDMQYYPTDLLTRQMTTDKPDRYGETWAGLDIGESRDKTVLVVIQGTRERAHVRHREVHGRTDDELLAKLIGDAFSVYKCSRVAVDATGMGSFPAKAARRKWGPKLEPVTFTPKVKEDLVTSLYQTLTEQTLWLPRDDTELRDDMCAIRRIVTSAGNVRFDAPRTAKGHADSAWALMLADHARGRVRKQGAYRELLGVERPRLASVL